MSRRKEMKALYRKWYKSWRWPLVRHARYRLVQEAVVAVYGKPL